MRRDLKFEQSEGSSMEGLHDWVRRSMRSHWSTNVAATLYDLACHSTSLRALQKGTDAGSEKGSNHHRRLNKRRGKQGTSLATVNDIRMGGSTTTTTTAQTTDAWTVVQLGSSSKSIPVLAPLNRNGFSACYVDSTLFSRVCAKMSLHEAQHPFMPDRFRETFGAERASNLTILAPKPQRRLWYQPKGAPKRGQEQVPAQQENSRSTQDEPVQSANEQ